jgi:hypothetical protein
MTDTAGSTLVRPEVGDPTLDGDHEKQAHVVVPASAVAEAYITGAPVTALCGKTWVPTRDPACYQVCPTCQEILDKARADKGAREGK